MRVSLAVGLVCVTSCCFATVHLKITRAGKLLGYATSSQRLTSTGGKVVDTRIEILRSGGPPAKVHNESTYDSTGHPVRMVTEVTEPGHTETIATFDAAGAHLTKIVHGVTTNSVVPRSAGSDWADPSQFWFLRDTPSPAAKCKCLVFLLDKGEWATAETTYLGRKEVDFGGSKVTANCVATDVEKRRTTSYLDDVGNLVLFGTNDGLRMERLLP